MGEAVHLIRKMRVRGIKKEKLISNCHDFMLVILSSNEIDIEIKNLDDIIKENFGILCYKLPGLKLKEKAGKIDWEITYINSDKSSYIVNKDEKRSLLKVRYDERVLPWDLSEVCLQIFEHYNQQKNFFTFHSASIEIAGKGVLLLGGRFSGKSTISLEHYLNSGYVLSTEKTLVDATNMKMKGNGTDYIVMKKGALAHFFGKNVLKKIDNYLEKERSYIIEITSHKDLPLDLIVLPKITSSRGQVFEVEPEKIKSIIYENITEVIRGVRIVSVPLPNMDDEVSLENRLRFLDKLQKIPAFFIEGDKRFILREIKRILHGETRF